MVVDLVCFQFEWAKTAGAILERFGGFSLHDILGDNILNSPLNAFTASTEAHDAFNRLDLWLTPAIVCSSAAVLRVLGLTSHKDDQHNVLPDTYDVNYYLGKEYLPDIGVGIKQRITFRTATVGSKNIPPPHPRLIGLHASCARIAHMSGVAEHLKELFRDTDMISVMTEPNAAYELTRALKTLQILSTGA